MPKVSVIINNYNGAKHLSKALSSAFNQTLKDWEIIFFDNGSQDQSIKIAESFGKKVKIFEKRDWVPLGVSRQMAIEKANGQYLAFLDTDDIWLPYKNNLQITEMEINNFSHSYGPVKVIDENDNQLYRIIPHHRSGFGFQNQLKHIEGMVCTTILDHKKIKEKNVSFDSSFRSSCEEDFVLRFLYPNEKTYVANKTLAFYRITSGSVTHIYKNRLGYERLLSYKKLKKQIHKFDTNFNASDYIAKAYFYQACKNISLGNIQKAQKNLEKASKRNIKYKIFLLFSWNKKIWFYLLKIKPYLSNVWLQFTSKI